MSGHEHGFRPARMIERAILEYKYFTSRGWSLRDVGEYWDSVTEYDDINEATYSYYRRFTNSWDMAKAFVHSGSIMMDIQTRTGKGARFWLEKGLISKAYLVDFSDHLLSAAKERLNEGGHDCEVIKVLDYSLPFDTAFFDLVTSYETIEHISDVDSFARELSRVLKPGGLMILTCPNILWEPVHWLSAILGIHHSEGPHNFLTRRRLLRLFKTNDLVILGENTTVILPFNNARSIALNEKLERVLPEAIRSLIGLRRTFVLEKPAEPPAGLFPSVDSQ